MTITVEFSMYSPSLPLVDLVESLPFRQLECEHGLCLKRDSDVFVIHIDPGDDISEEDLSAFDEVVEATSLGRTKGKDVYRLTVELVDDISEAFTPERFTAVEVEPMILTPDGWYEKKVFEDYETFDRLRTRFEEYGISIELISITQGSDSRGDSPQYGLTDRQYEALTLAISRGFYESPRQVSTEELAEEMGISQPSMSDLLRRGERQLLSSALEPQTHINALSAQERLQ
ncbi:helix-turn-helix domain-containing protein [Natrinema versiforme]|uniref:Bacterio-opsin activator n=1 Tax=Natrinema versiforme TaxID=88724 RepID=A0A4P8WLZ6_9EURY|nr:helix-turn-helix domain-containing protein [Natrinema versiforme]QCS44589.1 bacterio-opsin activator [Natrinema versiforme]